MGLKLKTAASTDAVSTTEVKAQCRIVGTDEDTLLTRLIKAATDRVEKDTARQLVSATYELTLSDFPSNRVIELPVNPVSSITSIIYLDTDNASQTLSSNVYYLDTYIEPSRIILKYNQEFPETLGTDNNVVITFVAGFTSVPDTLKSAILLLVGNLYENREATISGTIIADVPLAYEYLISAYDLSQKI